MLGIVASSGRVGSGRRDFDSCVPPLYRPRICERFDIALCFDTRDLASLGVLFFAALTNPELSASVALPSFTARMVLCRPSTMVEDTLVAGLVDANLASSLEIARGDRWYASRHAMSHLHTERGLGHVHDRDICCAM